MRVGFKIIPYNWHLRRAREEMGWSQRELAIAAETQAGVISDLERLQRPVTEDLATRIALALGREVGELFPLPTRSAARGWAKSSEFTREMESLEALPELDATLLPETVFAGLELMELQSRIQEAMADFSDREQRVLEMRFGLKDGTSSTLEEVAKRFGVTRESVRRIEAKALRKLRHPARSHLLRPYLTTDRNP